MTTYGPMTHRGRGVNPKPPEPGIRGRVVLRFLRRQEDLHGRASWPPSRLLTDCGLNEAPGYQALARLLELGLIERHLVDQDSLVRVRLTARGRRFRLAQP